MPRTARLISKSQVYHVMLRGNEKKDIFKDDEEKKRFIDTLRNKKQDENFTLYAYCIMDNHIHLVIKEQNDKISRIIKRIAISYAQYYNKKHKRIGHVFQDRYRSEPIEDQRHLLCAVRYVHNNPEKAGICKKTEYKWSSYRIYTKATKKYIELIECEEILDFFAVDKKTALMLFKEFSSRGKQYDFIDMEEEDKRLDREQSIEYINDYTLKTGVKLEFLNYEKYRLERDILIKELIEKSNLSLREISEITGINRETVRKAGM